MLETSIALINGFIAMFYVQWVGDYINQYDDNDSRQLPKAEEGKYCSDTETPFSEQRFSSGQANLRHYVFHYYSLKW